MDLRQHALGASGHGVFTGHKTMLPVGVRFGALVLALGLTAHGQISIQTVPVGDAGNATDPATGNLYGQVNHTYNIGKYEVTAGQFTAFLNAVAATDTYALYNTSMWLDAGGCKIQQTGSSGSYTYSVAADYANRPVNFVSFGDAMRFANWLHNGQPTGAQDAATTEDGAYFINGAITSPALNAVARKASWKWAVTSEDEWYKAAYYNPASGSYYEYPTRSNTAPGRDLADASGNNANYYALSPFPIDYPYSTTLVGEFQNSASPYGTFDQGGNVGEWNEAIISGSYRGNRGGSFANSEGIMSASYRSGGGDPTYENYMFAFRVSEVPEPASISLLALGAVTLLPRRRRL